MKRKKICMIGGSAVGKTSLVERFVKGIFSDKYLTTVGVKISKKTVAPNGEPVDLLLWDLNGEDRFQKLSTSYIRGSAGFFLVVDGTRKETFDKALVLHHKTVAEIGDVPFLVIINKSDLSHEWDVQDADLEDLKERGWDYLLTSAKTGTGVEEAFMTLTKQLA